MKFSLEQIILINNEYKSNLNKFLYELKEEYEAKYPSLVFPFVMSKTKEGEEKSLEEYGQELIDHSKRLKTLKNLPKPDENTVFKFV